jgi:zinc transport system ATP-binding protein
MNSDVPIIRAVDLTVELDGTLALDSVTLAVPRGDYVALVGPNGSGKTTLLRAILGLVRPTAGHVEVGGVPAERTAPVVRIGYVPQADRLPMPRFPATVEEIVATGLPRFLRASDTRDSVRSALDQVGLAGLAQTPIGSLSGGQRQRVMLARALVGTPELLLLDEPATALDPAFRQRFYDLLAELHRTQATTILLVSHDLGSVGQYARRLVYLEQRVRFDGTFEEFCRSPEMTALFGEFQQHLICHQHDARPV